MGTLAFYDGLPADCKEALFSYMRKLGEDELEYERRARSRQARYGEIAVGAADFDEFVKAEAIRGFLSALRRGQTVDQARDHARAEVRNAIGIHNSKRRDSTWQRADMTCDAQIDHMWRTARQRTIEPEGAL